MFKDFPYVDFDNFNSLGIDVVLEDEIYNIQLVFLNVIGDKDPEEGMVFRTPFFCKSLEEVGQKIIQLRDIGLFYHLDIFKAGHIIQYVFGEEGEEDEESVETVDWSIYCDFTKIAPFVPNYQQFHTLH